MSTVQSVKNALGLAINIVLAFSPFFIVFGLIFLLFRLTQSYSGLPSIVGFPFSHPHTLRIALTSAFSWCFPLSSLFSS